MVQRWNLPSVLVFAAMLTSGAAMALAEDSRNSPKGDRVIAIDVLLVPDETMWQKAVAANARLRENYPQGYTLGNEQVPHITLAHAYVQAKSLPAIEQQIEKLAVRVRPLRWQLTATEYTWADWDGLAITTIGIERTRPLDDLQLDVMKAISGSRVDGGTAAAFSTSRELPKVENRIVEYVENFAGKSSGKKYHPHITIGVAHADFVKRMQAEPFEKFTFEPASVAIYQLGAFGTAQKKLWEWTPN